MEDMARLAVFEQNIGDAEIFSKTLLKLLEYIGYILENPQDYELRTIKSDFLKRYLEVDGLSDYLTHIGFQINDSDITYPKELTLNKLRVARAAIERKLHFTCGNIDSHPGVIVKSSQSQPRLKTTKLNPSKVLSTKNEFLLKLEQLLNDVLKYEDEQLQHRARDQVPIVTLQLKALDRMREHQRKLKLGLIKGTDMSFDTALLYELLGWFKYGFFEWVDQPQCERCGGATVFERTAQLKTDVETCRLEKYRCKSCGGGASFARHNDPGTLLRTRRGRCGEWANCFTLLCRALGYDARYVCDVTDHVWTEVFDYDANRWLHCDPCEPLLDAPLVYESGWGKKLSYIIAVSRDDIQDVTWRYSSNHAALLDRRRECTEEQLISTIMTLREHRQSQVSPARRQYLIRRGVQELVQLMVEKKPTDYESVGRISGSTHWRQQRGEIGSKRRTFQFTEQGTYSLNYCTATDKYRVIKDGGDIESVKSWSDGAYEIRSVFRKVETDWRMVYLAREEESSSGSISWRVSASGDKMSLSAFSVAVSASLYEDATVTWTLQFDNEEPRVVDLNEVPRTFPREFNSVIVKAALRGGRGALSWQHAQLFRQSIGDVTEPFRITWRVAGDD